MNKEIFKDICGYENKYQISNFGRIKSLNYNTKREKILKLSKDKKGYLRIILTKNNIKKSYKVHRLVALHFISNPKDKPQVNHKNGKKSENYFKNLEWVTNKENSRHAYKNGLCYILKGEEIGTSKLKVRQVLEIRGLYPQLSTYKLAEKYNMDRSTIGDIVNRNLWKHI